MNHPKFSSAPLKGQDPGRNARRKIARSLARAGYQINRYQRVNDGRAWLIIERKEMQS